MEFDPKQRSFHQEAAYSHQGYPEPAVVVQRAMIHVQEDGSIQSFDAESNTQFALQPHQPVPLETLPADKYAQHLIEVARAIEGAVMHIALHPDQAEGYEKTLAHYLTGYRHDPAFIDYAASLTRITDQGKILHAPQLPPGSPFEWVTKLRTELASRKNE